MMIKRIIIFLSGLIVTYLVTIFALANIRVSEYTLFQYLTRTEVRAGWFGFSLRRFREVKNYLNIDILFVGSSHCYRSFDPRVFGTAGLTTFDIGSDAQSPLNSHYLLQRYTDRLSPRMVVFEVNPTIFRLDGLESFYDLLANSELSSEIVEMGWAVGTPQTINALAARILSVTDRSLSEVNQDVIFSESYIAGGHVSSDGVYRHIPIEDVGDLVILDKQINFLKWNIELVQSRGAQVLLVIAPIPADLLASVTNYDQITAKMDSIAQEYSIGFHDLNREMLFRKQSHFRDSHHLNSRGAIAFSNAILNMLRTTPEYATKLNLSSAFARLDIDDKTIMECTKLMKAEPENSDLYLTRGTAYRRKGFHLKAMADFTRVIELSPELAEGYFNRGNLYYDNQKLDEAIADFSRTIYFDPEHVAALGNRGVAFVNRGDTSLGMADFDAALAIEPTLEATLLSRGSTYMKLGQIEKAIVDFEAFLNCATEENAKYIGPVSKLVAENKRK